MGELDWDKAPPGADKGAVGIEGAGAAPIAAEVDVFNPGQPSRASLEGFVETSGYVSMEAEHYTRKVDAGPLQVLHSGTEVVDRFSGSTAQTRNRRKRIRGPRYDGGNRE